MHNVYVPVIAIIAAFAIIFGAQAISESHIDDDVAERIAQSLGTDASIDIEALEEVQKGYGLCGTYLAEGREAAPFYYSKVTERVTLDTSDSDYAHHCQH